MELGTIMAENRSTYLVAMGSNLEDEGIIPLEILQMCLAEFSGEGFDLVAVSRFYATPCFPAGAGPDYVNAAIVLRGAFSADETLRRLHKIETKFHRRRQQRWGMRTLDLDLLAVDQEIAPDIQTFNHWHSLPQSEQRTKAPEHLILPHPRVQDRAFVLVPLRDIAPDWVHPVFKLSVREMLKRCPASDVAEVRAL